MNMEDAWAADGTGIENFPATISLHRFRFLVRSMSDDDSDSVINAIGVGRWYRRRHCCIDDGSVDGEIETVVTDIYLIHVALSLVELLSLLLLF
ncbi:Hypothetical predicted protein [Octopus vulgaris]|uniref:Uncharacterized protein n=1 Tax=Octopus vulgaris TaxID=6645 RepID=A0AA36FBL5_OCTVU|nr:Hypothetical predicted protein [Octopus vulgaris]